MSEGIMDKAQRQEKMKEVIRELHAGKTVEEVKEKFATVIEGVSPKEIGEMEVQLVKEGLPIEEIQYLCDVHAEVFKGTLEEIHHPDQVAGHPIHTMRNENTAISELIEDKIKVNLESFNKDDSEENVGNLIEDFNLLFDIEKHYSRKENLIFPYLEKRGITAPPKVMWGVHDEIREKLKDAKESLMNYKGNKEEVAEKIQGALTQIVDMIFKEESILFPMSLETLIEDEWIEIYKESDEIGYTLIAPDEEWELKRVDLEKQEEEKGVSEGGFIKFENGLLSAEEIAGIFEVIPGELSFVDKDNLVKFFTKGEERIFTRTKALIGRSVENGHRHASVQIVNKIVEDFKSGEKDNEQFWIQMGELFVLIKFFAVRNKDGEYLGTLEYVQNIKPLMSLEGEKRLMSE